MELSHIGWREALLLAIVIIAAYLGYALLRLVHLRGRQGATAPVPQAPPPAVPPELELIEPAAAAPSASSFAVQQFMLGVQAELDLVRSEMAAMREEIAKLKAVRGAAPQYTEAMELAQSGADAEMIADHCGISVGEAELVLSLACQGVKDHREG